MRTKTHLDMSIARSRLLTHLHRSSLVRLDRGIRTTTASSSSSSSLEQKRLRTPFPISEFEHEKSEIPVAARFLWSYEGKTAGTGLRKFPSSSESYVFEEFADEQTWLQEMKLKHEILDSHESECVVFDEDKNTDEACFELLEYVVSTVTNTYADRIFVSGVESGIDERFIEIPKLDGFKKSLTNVKNGRDALILAARLTTSELCLMRQCDDDDERDRNSNSKEHRFVAGVVCFSFDPKKRDGKNLSELHKPVPGYEAKIASATRKVFDNLLKEMEDDGQPLWRANWAVQNSGDLISTDLNWHPTNVKIGGVKNRKAALMQKSAEGGEAFENIDDMHTGYFDPTQEMPQTISDVGEKMQLRVEYETISKLKRNNKFSLFTVKTYLEKLQNFCSEEAAEALYVAITEASESELKYKSLENENLRRLILDFLKTKLARKLPMPVLVNGDKGGRNASAFVSSTASSLKKCPMGFGTAKVVEEEEEEVVAVPSELLKQNEILPKWYSYDKSIEEASPLPPSYYTRRDISRVEQTTILSPEESWVCIGVVSDAPNVNDYFTTTVFGDGNANDDEDDENTLNLEIVCIRKEDGTFVAYENVCAHHFAKIAVEKRGSCEPVRCSKKDNKNNINEAGAEKCTFALKCPYHGFTYDVNDEGRLISATKMKGVEGRTSNIKLKGDFVCETFGPFVFLKRRKNEIQSLRSFLGEAFVDELLHEANIDVQKNEFVHVKRETFDVASNWKVFCDNYLDGGFHVPFAHKDLVRDGCDMSAYSIKLFDNKNSIQSVKTKKTKNNNLNNSNRLGSEAVYGFAFPNVMVNRYGEWLDTNVAKPHPSGDPNKCIVEFNWFLRTQEHERLSDTDLQKALEASVRVQREDENLCALVQRGLRSKLASTSLKDEGLYSPEVEHIMFAFHRKYYDSVRRE